MKNDTNSKPLEYYNIDKMFFSSVNTENNSDFSKNSFKKTLDNVMFYLSENIKETKELKEILSEAKLKKIEKQKMSSSIIPKEKSSEKSFVAFFEPKYASSANETVTFNEENKKKIKEEIENAEKKVTVLQTERLMNKIKSLSEKNNELNKELQNKNKLNEEIRDRITDLVCFGVINCSNVIKKSKDIVFEQIILEQKWVFFDNLANFLFFNNMEDFNFCLKINYFDIVDVVQKDDFFLLIFEKNNECILFSINRNNEKYLPLAYFLEKKSIEQQREPQKEKSIVPITPKTKNEVRFSDTKERFSEMKESVGNFIQMKSRKPSEYNEEEEKANKTDVQDNVMNQIATHKESVYLNLKEKPKQNLKVEYKEEINMNEPDALIRSITRKQRVKNDVVEEINQKLLKSVKVLQNGFMFLKYGKFGDPKERLILLSSCQGKFEWRAINKKMGETIEVESILEIKHGRSVGNFKRFKKQIDAEKISFSLVFKERNLDLEAGTLEIKEKFLGELINFLGKKNIKINS